MGTHTLESDRMNKNSDVFLAHLLTSFILWFAMLVIVAFTKGGPRFSFWFGLGILIVAPIITAFGSFSGRKFRDFTKPDFIVTSGVFDTFKTKIFWKIGPQFIGWFIGAMLVENIFFK